MDIDSEVIEIDVQLDKKTLNRFLIRNNFLRAGGVIGLLISIAAIAGLIAFWNYFGTAQRVILIFLGLMFTVIQPLTLLMKGWEQLKNGAFCKPFHYTFSREGIEVINIAGTVNIEWENIRKIVTAKEAMYIYMNPVSALIIPKSECGGEYVALARMAKECTG